MAIERIQVRRDTAANWAMANPILASGEWGLETDSRSVKIGDGISVWTSLAYFSGGEGGGGGVTSVAGRAGVVTLTSADLTDSTSIGRALVEATNQAAGRTAIGAQVSGNYASATDLNNTFSIAVGAQADIDAFEATKAQPNGLASLDGGGKVPSAQLPSYVDDVLEFGSIESFPGTGETGKIYIAQDTGWEYRWSGSTYIRIVASPGSTDAVPEGTTNLYFSDARAQSALVTALAGKVPITRQVNGHALNADVTVSKADVGLSNADNTSDVNKPVSTAQQTALDLKAPLASPALTGAPTAPTPSAASNNTRVATTAYVDAADNLKAPLASPALTGSPTAPTPSVGDNDTSVATTAFVHGEISAFSPNITKIVTKTQAAYDALVSGGTVDSATLYVIVG
jgi:hypothetical protein